jgi:hypothetical protein
MVVLEIIWEETQTGPLEGSAGTIPPSGKRAVLPAVEVMRMESGRSKENHLYFDLMGLLQQIGAVPTGG